MKKTIAILLFFLSMNMYGQDSTNNNPGILTKKSFGPYRLNGGKISSLELKQEIYKVPEAIPFYKISNKNFINAGICILVSAGCIFLLDNPDRVRSPFKQHTGWYTVGLISFGASYYFILRSNKFMKKSINVYNERRKIIY